MSLLVLSDSSPAPSQGSQARGYLNSILTFEGDGSGGAAPGEVRAGVGMMGAASGV